MITLSERRVRNREIALKIKKEKKCINCEENHSACLEFYSETGYSVRELIKKGASVARLDKAIEKSTIYCSNCRSDLSENQETQINPQRQWLKDLKKKEKCLSCGKQGINALDYHHIDPKNKKDSISKLVRILSQKEVLAEIKKCIVMCKNCHKKLHYYEENGNIQ